MGDPGRRATVTGLRPLSRGTLLGSILVGIAIVAALVAIELDTAFLNVLPALFALATLLLRPRLGEALIECVIGRRRRSPRGAPASWLRGRPADSRGGGRLIGLSLGGRAPPQAAGCAQVGSRLPSTDRSEFKEVRTWTLPLPDARCWSWR